MKQAWFDFSSGKNGSIFDFVMMTEGVTFPEAVERLAAQAGMALPQVSEEAQADAVHRKSLYEVMELAAKFFEATLAARAGAPRPRLLGRPRPRSQYPARLPARLCERRALRPQGASGAARGVPGRRHGGGRCS